MPTINGSEDRTRGGKKGRGRTALYSVPSDTRLTAAAEDGEQPEGGSLLASRTSRSGMRSRSGRRRVDWRGVHGLLRVANGAIAVGILLISVMAIRLVICSGASGLYMGIRQGPVSGKTSRRLADENVPLLSSPSTYRSSGLYGTLSRACLGSDDPVFGPGDERPEPGPASGVFDSSLDGGQGASSGRVPLSRQEKWQARLRNHTFLLGFAILALCLAGFLSFFVGLSTGATGNADAPSITIYVFAGLAFTLVIPFLYRFWREIYPPLYQPIGQQEVRL
ncbi:hypothetical protein CSUI_010663 [Cystoisospora suis]|uniref:Transmembrane protein n=1 Tax=Cystoisospora suis TaxID=483139 RepID=A0A2C6KGR3_9APIC|nr:hypothetical protein CSUI_010663 [Cystoisospora suis]